MDNYHTALTDLLEKLKCLLGTGGEIEWSNCISRLHERACGIKEKGELKEVAREIMKLYGGMGSFSDLVLYKGGSPCAKENDDLDSIRRQLFDISVKIVTEEKKAENPSLL